MTLPKITTSGQAPHQYHARNRVPPLEVLVLAAPSLGMFCCPLCWVCYDKWHCVHYFLCLSVWFRSVLRVLFLVWWPRSTLKSYSSGRLSSRQAKSCSSSLQSSSSSLSLACCRTSTTLHTSAASFSDYCWPPFSCRSWRYGQTRRKPCQASISRIPTAGVRKSSW